MTRRSVAVALMAAALLVGVQAAGADTTYTDPAGDSGTAPDITTITVSNGSAGNITFAVAFSPPTITSSEGLGVYIDSDQNSSTGDPAHGGSDYVIFLYATSSDFYAWSGSNFVSKSHGPLTASATATGSTITVNNADLGGVQGFRFWVESQKASPSGALEASDVAGPYRYTLTTPPTPTTPAASLSLGAPSAVGPIKAGKRFVISAKVTSSGSPVKVACATKAGPRTLIAKGTFAAGAATCSGTAPPGTTGRKLTGSIAASITGAKATRTFAFPIR